MRIGANRAVDSVSRRAPPRSRPTPPNEDASRRQSATITARSLGRMSTVKTAPNNARARSGRQIGQVGNSDTPVEK